LLIEFEFESELKQFWQEYFMITMNT